MVASWLFPITYSRLPSSNPRWALLEISWCKKWKPHLCQICQPGAMGPCQGHVCLPSFPHGVDTLGPRGLCVCRHIPEVRFFCSSVACTCIDRSTAPRPSSGASWHCCLACFIQGGKRIPDKYFDKELTVPWYRKRIAILSSSPYLVLLKLSGIKDNTN